MKQNQMYNVPEEFINFLDMSNLTNREKKIFTTFIETYKDNIREFITVDLKKIICQKYDEKNIKETLQELCNSVVTIEENDKQEYINLINKCNISGQVRVHSKIRKMFKMEKEKISSKQFNEKLEELNLDINILDNINKIKLPLTYKLLLGILIKNNCKSKFELDLRQIREQCNKYILIEQGELREALFDLYTEDILIEKGDRMRIFTPILLEGIKYKNQSTQWYLQIHPQLL